MIFSVALKFEIPIYAVFLLGYNILPRISVLRVSTVSHTLTTVYRFTILSRHVHND